MQQKRLIQLFVAALSLILIGDSRVLAQQPEGGKAYLSTSLLATTRPAQPRDYHYQSPMLGGTTPAIAVEGGWFTAPTVSIGGELQIVMPLTGTLVFNHFLHNSWDVSYRETYALAVVRVHLLGGHLAPLFVAGPAFDRRHFTNGLEYHDAYYDPRPPDPLPDRSSSQTNLLFGGGMDIVGTVGRRTSIFGSFRLCTVNRDDSVAGEHFIGVRNVTVQAGGGVRWTFR